MLVDSRPQLLRSEGSRAAATPEESGGEWRVSRNAGYALAQAVREVVRARAHRAGICSSALAAAYWSPFPFGAVHPIENNYPL